MEPLSLALMLAGKFAPDIVKYFTNSETAGAVAGQVIDIAKTITGKGTAEEAAEAINADPAMATQFKLAVMANDADLEKAFLADRQDARRRDVDLHKAGFANDRATWMIVGDVVGMLACLGAMVYITFLGVTAGTNGDTSQVMIMALNGPLGMLTQQFANGLRDAHQFEFGSSRGSQEKTELLAYAPPIRTVRKP
ncbi:MAG: hypothetical protein V4451_04670 [Pseudomonadota bacterium]